MGEFCIWEEVSVAAFYVWRKKLAGGKPGRRTARSPATTEVVPRTSGPLSRESFLPVRMAERPQATADVPAPAVNPPDRTGLGDSAPATPACIEVRLTNGVRIFVPGIELDALHEVIRAVGRLATEPCDDANAGKH